MKYLLTLVMSGSLAACSESKKVATPAEAVTIEQNAGSSPAMVYNAGMMPGYADFSATGGDPVNWNMQITTDDSLRFESSDGLLLSARFAAMKKTMSGKTEVYSGKVRSGDLKIEITEEQCSVASITSKIAYTRRVAVTYNGKEFRGCGRYDVNDNLNGKWMLERIGNKNIAVEDYNKVPVFNFNLQTKNFGGNDGCNSIGGDFEVQGNRIKFGDLISTKMACMKKDITALMSAQISGKTVTYFFERGKLVLYLGDDSKLYFKR